MAETPDGPQTRDVPQSFLEKVREKPWTYAGIVASIVIPLIIGSWLLFQSGGGFSSYPGKEDAGVETSRGVDIPESSAATLSGEVETAAEDAAGSASDGSSDVESKNAVAPVIAYRKDGVIWVAAEDGSSPQKVVTSDRGSFALSPNGTMIAWIDGEAGVLHIAEVGGKDTKVGPAEDSAPAWAPDSAWLVYTVPTPSGTEVWRAAADGSVINRVASGHTPHVASDAESIALVTSAGPGVPGDVAIVSPDGKRLGGVSDAMAVEAVPVEGRVVYSVAGGKDAEEIVSADFDGSGAFRLVGPARLGVSVVYAQLMPSWGDDLLLYAATGDDGYSRAYVVEVSEDGSPFSLTVRRDTYPLRWGIDDAHLFIVEGNAFQGESTSVLSASRDGFGRTVVAEGGGL